ncbi:MAG TPA: hypothetical protein PKY30_04275, partial [Myxococcota bacterium]|nr:hypothetical protein [Myxococcota bacterium]
MIRMDLGTAPPEFAAAAESALNEAVTTFNLHGPGSAELKTVLAKVYKQAKPVLRERQRKKCAYCEKTEDAFKRPVEHFRPKGGAEDKSGTAWIWVSTHYWWLTWTWTNLYFSCDSCNHTGNKGNRFPLQAGTLRMPAPVQGAATYPLDPSFFDTSQEKPLLIDPRQDRPECHLQWKPLDAGQ